MYSRPEQILEQYDLKVKSISRGRDCYFCDTDLGLKVLSEYRGSKERAGFLAEMLDFLREHDFAADNVIRTKEGETLAVDEDESKYWLSDAYSGAECDTKSIGDMVAGVRQLAHLHNISSEFTKEVPEYIKKKPDSLLILYRKHNRELRQVRNFIRSRKKRNEFEELFLKQYDRFAPKAEKITTILEQMPPEDTSIGFCHGDFNQHNIIFSKQGIAIVRFENFSYDIRVSDLANFVRKMMEKNNWNAEVGMELIEAYRNVREMTPEEFLYLSVYLAYPEKFWKIANHYNNSHKAWLSGRNMEKLEKVIVQESAREEFLQKLFHFAV